MSHEAEVKALLLADSAITAIFSTRIFTSAEAGRNGLTQESTPTIYNATTGSLEPCILIKDGEATADGQVLNYDDRDVSILQVTRIWFYEEKGYTNINSGKIRTRYLLIDFIFSDGFEPEFVLETENLRDPGSLAGASMVRQDWSANTIF